MVSSHFLFIPDFYAKFRSVFLLQPVSRILQPDTLFDKLGLSVLDAFINQFSAFINLFRFKDMDITGLL